MPHHVRFPDQYTAYTLDEPITVGGGDWSSADSGSSEQLNVRFGFGTEFAASESTRLHTTAFVVVCPEPLLAGLKLIVKD